MSSYSIGLAGLSPLSVIRILISDHAVGIFDVVVDPHRPYVTNFCLQGRSRELTHTTAFLSQVRGLIISFSASVGRVLITYTQAFEFFEEYLGEKFPYPSYKQVFVEDIPTKCSSYGSLSLFRLGWKSSFPSFAHGS